MQCFESYESFSICFVYSVHTRDAVMSAINSWHVFVEPGVVLVSINLDMRRIYDKSVIRRLFRLCQTDTEIYCWRTHRSQHELVAAASSQSNKRLVIARLNQFVCYVMP